MADKWTLSDGTVAEVEMPDLFGILGTVGAVPSPVIAAVLDLLVADQAYTPEQTAAQIYVQKRDQVRGMYALASLMLQSPKLVLSGRPGPGEIGVSRLSFADVEGLYYRYFRYGHRQALQGAAGSDQPDGAQGASSAGGDISPDAG